MGLGKNNISNFFDLFEMDYDKLNGCSFKLYMRESILLFLNNECKETAFDVYNTFLDCYRIKGNDNNNFIDILDILKSYEENAATLLDKQRDHYVHSVNVFILGIYIYEQNTNYKESYELFYHKDQYGSMHSQSCEEFFYQWGMASLFHDIGYPVEITSNQIKKFIRFVVDIDQKVDAKPYIGYLQFKNLNSITETISKSEGNKHFDGNKFINLNPLNPLDLLSYNISITLGIKFEIIKEVLDEYVNSMQESGYVDHGYYSAIIVLKCYGNLLQKSGQSLELLYHPVLNAATAILLHNFYKNVLQKPPFELGQLSATIHPIAYLLILCDELQEWNREAYGILDKQKVLAADSDITVTENQLSIHYITYEQTLSEDFSQKKEEVFKVLLNLEEIFPDSIQVTCTTKSDMYIEKIKNKDKYILPRPILENLEKIAKEIHSNYNRNQIKNYKDKPLEYPEWESLPDTLKYSNIRQARGIFDKLKKYGYIATFEQEGREEIAGFSLEQIEELARDEHDEWWMERKSNGWVYAKEKNVDKKTSPYMLPYDELSEEIKELDRDAVRNVFPLVQKIGLKIYKN